MPDQSNLVEFGFRCKEPRQPIGRPSKLPRSHSAPQSNRSMSRTAGEHSAGRRGLLVIWDQLAQVSAQDSDRDIPRRTEHLLRCDAIQALSRMTTLSPCGEEDA